MKSQAQRRSAVVVNPPQLSAVRAIHSPPYARSDTGSGRCRLPLSVFRELNIQLGWIILIKLSVPLAAEDSCGSSFDLSPSSGSALRGANTPHAGHLHVHVLCTAWPHSCQSAASSVSIDDAVWLHDLPTNDDGEFESSSYSRYALDWSECYCQVNMPMHYAASAGLPLP